MIDPDSTDALLIRHMFLVLLYQTDLACANEVNLCAIACGLGGMAQEMNVPDEELIKLIEHGRKTRIDGAKTRKEALELVSGAVAEKDKKPS